MIHLSSLLSLHSPFLFNLPKFPKFLLYPFTEEHSFTMRHAYIFAVELFVEQWGSNEIVYTIVDELSSEFQKIMRWEFGIDTSKYVLNSEAIGITWAVTVRTRVETWMNNSCLHNCWCNIRFRRISQWSYILSMFVFRAFPDRCLKWKGKQNSDY